MDAQTESCESAFARVVPEVVQDLVRKILPTAALTRPELVRDHAWLWLSRSRLQEVFVFCFS